MTQSLPPLYDDYVGHGQNRAEIRQGQTTSSSPLFLSATYDARLPGFYFCCESHESTTYATGDVIMLARIPKKREGWKAEVSKVKGEKGQLESCYEVRREVLSKRIDFRAPDGQHNVMVGRGIGHAKIMEIEAPDGQRLVWRVGTFQSTGTLQLVSKPSGHVLAEFSSLEDSRVGGGKGMLEIRSVAGTMAGHEHQSSLNTPQTNAMGSTEESDEDEEGEPRLGRNNRTLSVGLALPGMFGIAIASPYSAAGLNARCPLADEFMNLGRTIIRSSLANTTPTNKDFSQAEGMYDRNHYHSAKSSDPRPRNAPLDLVIASLVAILDA